jgi:hypothetical protein
MPLAYMFMLEEKSGSLLRVHSQMLRTGTEETLAAGRDKGLLEDQGCWVIGCRKPLDFAMLPEYGKYIILAIAFRLQSSMVTSPPSSIINTLHRVITFPPVNATKSG